MNSILSQFSSPSYGLFKRLSVIYLLSLCFSPHSAVLYAQDPSPNPDPQSKVKSLGLPPVKTQIQPKGTPKVESKPSPNVIPSDPSPVKPQSEPKDLFKDKIMAQAGPITFTQNQAVEELKKMRTWIQFELNHPPPLQALENPMTLRKLIIQALEHQVVVQEAKKQLPALSLEESKKWVYNKVPATLRPTFEGFETFLRGRLKRIPNASLDDFWMIAQEHHLVERFKQYQIDHLSIDEAQHVWQTRSKKVEARFFMIPRIPSSAEITQEVRTNQREIKKYFEQNIKFFSQPLRILGEPFWIRGGKGPQQQRQLEEIKALMLKGQSVQNLLQQFPMFSYGQSRTLKGRGIPKGTDLKDGTYTPLVLTRKGWTFYKVKKVYPASVRDFKSSSVQREIAATLLRNSDRLTHSKAKAKDLINSLKTQSLSTLQKWAKSNRVRIKTPNPFFKHPNGVIPQIGKAVELHDQVFKLKEGEILGPIQVRQNYIVAQILAHHQGSQKWTDVQESFVKNWRKEKAPQILNRWLDQYLKDKSLWLSRSMLDRFPWKNLEPQKVEVPSEKILEKMVKDQEQKQSQDQQQKKSVPSLPKSNPTSVPTPSP